MELYSMHSVVSTSLHSTLYCENQLYCSVYTMLIRYSIYLFIHFTLDGHLGSSQFGTITNSAAWTAQHMSLLYTDITFLLDIYLGVELLFYRMYTLGLSICYQTVFQNTSFYSHQQYENSVPHPHQHLVVSFQPFRWLCSGIPLGFHFTCPWWLMK